MRKMTHAQYLENDDWKIFRHETITLGIQQMLLSAATVAGTKDGITRRANEDAYSVIEINGTLICAVFDGTSSQKPIPELGEETGARFASHFLKNIFEEEQCGVTPSEMTRTLNALLLKENLKFKGASVDDVHSLPTSTATIVQIDSENKELAISHLGDSFCMLFYSDGHSALVTEDKNRIHDEQTLALLQKIADEKNCTPREARKDPRIKAAVIKMFQDTHNTSDGSGQGVMNGDPRAEKYIQDIRFPLEGIAALSLGSDGLIPPGWDEQNESDRQKMYAILKRGGVEELIQVKQNREDADSDWNFLRYKHSDDATAVFVEDLS